MRTRHARVVVVGGGVVGLACAARLRGVHGLGAPGDVVVLEAHPVRLGGRVRQARGFVRGVPLELGAEFIHGSTTSLNRMAARHGVPLEERVSYFCRTLFSE